MSFLNYGIPGLAARVGRHRTGAAMHKVSLLIAAAGWLVAAAVPALADGMPEPAQRPRAHHRARPHRMTYRAPSAPLCYARPVSGVLMPTSFETEHSIVDNACCAGDKSACIVSAALARPGQPIH